MGWGKLIGDLAKDYISERGIGGALEDAGSIKDGIGKLFGGSDDDNDEEANQQYQQIVSIGTMIITRRTSTIIIGVQL